MKVESRKMKDISQSTFFLLVAVLLAVTFSFSKWEKKGKEATLTWDVSGYYLYLPAVFIYGDLRELTFMPEILERYEPTFELQQAFLHEQSGHYVLKYSMGQALLYSPFFLLAHLAAKVSGYPADGFSLPYQMAISWGSLLVAVLGLWWARRNLLRYFGETTVAAALLVLVLGTNYLNYSTTGAALTHNYLFTLYALLIDQSIRWHERPGYRRAVGIGLLVGLMALVRPSEIIAATIPLLWGMRSIGTKLAEWRQHWQKLLAAALMMGLVGSLQLIYWKFATGNWIVYSYGEQGFTWLHPHVWDVLFSYRKGWLVYTPLMAVAVLGLIGLPRRLPALTLAVLAYSLLNFYIVSAWDIWWYGGSFGQRAMVQSYAVWLFPLAVALEWVGRQRLLRWPAYALVGAGVLLNLFQTWQSHGPDWEAEYMNKAYFWRIFANPDPGPQDRYLLDTGADFRGERQDVRMLYRTDFEGWPDSAAVSGQFYRSGRYAAYVDGGRAFSATVSLPVDADSLAAASWIRATGWFYSPMESLPPLWLLPQLNLLLLQQGEVVQQSHIRIQRSLTHDTWQERWLDLPLSGQPFDEIRVYIWNADGNVPLYLDDLRVESFR